jgi:carbon storage regulator
MLVLARKAHETIQIGSDISISIVSVRGRVVRVGIEAPTGVRVVRGELLASSKATGEDSSIGHTSKDQVSDEKPAKPVHTQEAFRPTARISTAHINRVLSMRRLPKPLAPVMSPALAVS